MILHLQSEINDMEKGKRGRPAKDERYKKVSLTVQITKEQNDKLESVDNKSQFAREAIEKELNLIDSVS